MCAAKGPAIVPSTNHVAQLCSLCLRLELIGPETLFEFKYDDEWPAFNGLAQSSAAGCDFCRMLRDIVVISPRHMKQFGKGSRRVRVILRTVHNLDGETTESGDWLHTLYGLKIFMHDAQASLDDRDQLDTSFLCTSTSHTKSSIASPSDSWETGTIITTLLSAPTVSVLSERNLSFIQDCITKSEESTESMALDLPTRLLDLAELPFGRVKLVISHEIPDGLSLNIRYAALSYCWGDRETARHQSITTVNNLKGRKSGFDVKYLSSVIQDAIQVCSSLSIRFLWVDALCILQGDSRDWGEESQRLWETFRGAYITICAASSTSCQEGFLQDRLIHPGLNIKLGSAYGGQTSTRTPERASAVNCRIIPIPRNVLASNQGDLEYGAIHFIGDIFESRWLHRGWVHQEMAFSRRLLIFGTHLMFVRCSDVTACENEWRTSYSGIMLDGLDLVELRKNPFSHFWRDVERFCSKQFTYRTDVLPAMAALARQVHRETGSQYLAGMWRKNLANDLLFQVSSIFIPAARDLPIEQRLEQLSDPDGLARPSWSWLGHRESFGRGASLRTRYCCWLVHVGGDDEPWTLDCAVVKAVADLVNENPFGAVSRAYLTIRCRMIERKELVGRATRFKISTCRFPGPALWGVIVHWDTWDQHGEPSVPRTVKDRISLICTSQRPNTKGKLGGNLVAGLIVYPAATNGEYYRIGMWHQNCHIDPTESCLGGGSNWLTQTITLI